MVHFLSHGLVFRRGESHETFFIHVQPQWVDTGDTHVNSYIKLVSVDEIWIIQIFGNSVTLSLGYVLHGLVDDDTSALRCGAWFEDVPVVGVLRHYCCQKFSLLW